MDSSKMENMVSRFLQWKLPDDFCPDGGITFNPKYNWPVGTNLLTATQARDMLSYVVGEKDQAEALCEVIEKQVASPPSVKQRLVIIESPYAGNVERNVLYAREAVRDSLLRGEAPIASHLLYTQEGILQDDIPEERVKGIDAGLAWRRVADATVVYVDLGLSAGMMQGILAAQERGIPVEFRSLCSIDGEVTYCVYKD